MTAMDRVRAAGIINAHDAMTKAVAAGYDGPDIVLDYYPADTGRGGQSARWQVWSLSHQTNPGGHWSECGHKTWTVYAYGTEKHSAVKARREQEAREWAAERYGVTEWAKVPGLFGAPYLPADAARIVRKLVADAAKATAQQAAGSA